MLQVLVIIVAIPGLKRESTSTVLLPAAVIVQARFGDIVQDAKVRSAIGTLGPKVVPLPVTITPANLARYAIVGVESVPLGVDAAIGCEVLDGVITCWCPGRRLVAALQHHIEGARIVDVTVSHAEGFPGVDRLIGAFLRSLSVVEGDLVDGRICGWEIHSRERKARKGRHQQEEGVRERQVADRECTR